MTSHSNDPVSDGSNELQLDDETDDLDVSDEIEVEDEEGQVGALENDEAPEAGAAKTAPGISPKTLRLLRALAHPLRPIVQVGKEGITQALVAALEIALRDHELVKVKVLAEAPVDRHDAGEALASGTRAVLVQVLGRIVVLYKRHPEKPKVIPTKASTHPKPKRGRPNSRKGKGASRSRRHA